MFELAYFATFIYSPDGRLVGAESARIGDENTMGLVLGLIGDVLQRSPHSRLTKSEAQALTLHEAKHWQAGDVMGFLFPPNSPEIVLYTDTDLEANPLVDQQWVERNLRPDLPSDFDIAKSLQLNSTLAIAILGQRGIDYTHLIGVDPDSLDPFAKHDYHFQPNPGFDIVALNNAGFKFSL